MITESQKRKLLKEFSRIFKKVKGKGPKNIFISHSGYDVSVHIHGFKTEYEEYLVDRFGNEAVDILDSFYRRDCHNIEKKLSEKLKCFRVSEIRFHSLETDFIQDKFVYKMKIR